MFTSKKMHFEISERKVLLRLFDVLFVLTALYLAGNILDWNYFTLAPTNYYWIIVLAIYINVFGAIFEMYNLQVSSNQLQVLKSIILTVSSTVLAYILTPIVTPELPSKRLQIIVFYVVVFMALFLWRMIYVLFLASNRFVQNVILVCNKDQVKELVLGIENVDPHYKIVAYINVDEFENTDEGHYLQNIRPEDLQSFVKNQGISEIVISSRNPEGVPLELSLELLNLLASGKIIREYTQVYETKMQRIPLQYIARDFYKFFLFSRSNQNRLYLLMVRIFELVVATAGLFVGIALIPIILIGNGIGNRGTLFYTQKRVGKDGIVFKILKFRTMIKNSEKFGAVFATHQDSRVTPFGKFLRKTRIDEFPQMINIIKGDMAVIGPRPERPFFVKEIAHIMPLYETRHVIKPGLTGWAQVNYSYGESIEDSLIKLQYDLYYIKHRSVYLDLSITFKTITTVLFYRGQ